jgi:two-component system chemotaxis response regulator CheY
VTTDNATEDKNRAFELGANAYITKPIQASQVIATIRQLLGIS